MNTHIPILSSIAKSFKQMMEWINRGSSIEKTIKQLFFLCIFFYLFKYLSYPIGAFSLYFPKLWCSVISSLIIASFLILLYFFIGKLLNSPVSPKNLTLILRIGLVLSILSVCLNFGLFIFSHYLNSKENETLKYSFLNDVQYPIGDPQSIALSDEDNILLGLTSYGRIQVYDKNGNFIKGWFVGATGGPFVIWTDDNKKLHAIITRSEMHKIYDFNGNLIEAKNIENVEKYIELDNKGKLVQTDSLGNIYSLKDIRWKPTVTRTDLKNVETKIIEDPFWLWITKKPAPNWHILVLSMVIAVFLGVILYIEKSFPALHDN